MIAINLQGISQPMLPACLLSDLCFVSLRATDNQQHTTQQLAVQTDERGPHVSSHVP